MYGRLLPREPKGKRGGRRGGGLVTGTGANQSTQQQVVKASLNWLLAVHPIEGSVRFGIDQRKSSCKPESPLILYSTDAYHSSST